MAINITETTTRLKAFWEKRSVLVLVVAVSIFVAIISTFLLLGSLKGKKGPFPADTHIVAVKGDYAYENTTNEFESQFKNRATLPESIVFKNTIGRITFYTPLTQSFGELNSDAPPTPQGSTLLYPNIFNQIDLSYTVSSSRLLEEFIVKDKDTANKIDKIEQRAKTSASYQENKDGSITFTESDKTAFTLPHPVLYEQGNPENKSDGINYQIKKDGDELVITKVITEKGKAWINDKKRVFPIVIDLVIDNADTSGNWVSSDSTYSPVTQEATIKQEGSGSVKIQTTSEGSGPTVDLMEYSSDANARAAYVAANSSSVIATGGTITSSGGNNIHTFNSSGTFTTTLGGNVTYLVIAGGGGGGDNGGAGGGAGGYLTGSLVVTPQAYSVTVGAGGAGSAVACGSRLRGANGSNSVFSTITATGGGGGACNNGGAGTGNGSAGGSGGGAASYNTSNTGGAATSGQGFKGSDTASSGNILVGGGGGGAGGAAANINNSSTGTPGGAGLASSITGSSVTRASGGSGYLNTTATPGGGGAWNTVGTANTGGGGGAYQTGGSGVVIISYPAPVDLQAYNEATIKTEGSYSLKSYAEITTALNKTLTRTIGSPLDLSNRTSVTFDIRAARTGSNIKVGLHDTGGTTTEVTPNIASADVFQSATLDLSGVTNVNKDAIDQIIVTVVNADAVNTFYIDNMIANPSTFTTDDTVTLTASPTDLTGTTAALTYWVRSSVAGTFSRFQFGESASSEQTNNITISQVDTWEQKTWDITGITGTARDAVTKFAFQFTGNTSGAAFYFDDIRVTHVPIAPTIGTGTALTSSSIRWSFTDNSSGETGFKVYDTSNNLVATCASPNISTCDETGLSPNTQYTRKVVAYNDDGNSAYSGTATSNYTLAAAPGAPSVTNRAATTVSVNPDPGTNPASTEMAIYKEEGTTCDGVGGSYIAANGSDNGSTAVWQSDTTWGTVTVTGLNSEKVYSFCAKARNGNNTEAGFGTAGTGSGGYVPLTGDFVVTADTSFTGGNRYVDGNDASRYVIGLDSGSGSTNTANLEVQNGVLTISANETVAVASVTLTGGSIAIADGGVISIGSPVWMVDADSDGYSIDAKLYYGDQPAGGRRKYLATTLASTDCGDGNANAYPGSASCLGSTFTNNSGQASYDWNCSGSAVACSSTYYSSTTIQYENVCGSQGCCCCTGFATVTNASLGCGQAGYQRGTFTGYGHPACQTNAGYALGTAGNQTCN